MLGEGLGGALSAGARQLESFAPPEVSSHQPLPNVAENCCFVTLSAYVPQLES